MRFRWLVPLAAAATIAGLMPATPAYAADTTPPTAPGLPVASGLTETSVTLTWAASTDDVGVASYEVWRIYTDIVQRVAVPTATTATVTGLNRGSESRFYVVAIDTSGNRSRSSPLLYVVTLPGDLEPPGPVIGLAASEITDSSVRVSWQGHWWGDAAIYRVYRGQTVVGQTSAVAPVVRTFVVTGLSPGTEYLLGVTAVDAAGNQSGIIPIRVTTTGGPPNPIPPPPCTVSYKVTSQWTGGFVAEVRVVNLLPRALTGWTVSWTFPGNQRITNLWQGAFTQTGADVAVTNLSYNAELPASGGAQSFGFLASWSDSNASPARIALNGNGCVLI